MHLHFIALGLWGSLVENLCADASPVCMLDLDSWKASRDHRKL